MIDRTEPFTIEEIWSMNPTRLGDFLGELFGFYANQRLIVERDHGGDVSMVIETIQSRTFPSTNPRNFDIATYTAPHTLRTAGCRASMNRRDYE